VAVKRSIREGVPITGSETLTRGARCWIWFGPIHMYAPEQIHNVFGLTEMKVLMVAVNMNAKEEGESAEVL